MAGILIIPSAKDFNDAVEMLESLARSEEALSSSMTDAQQNRLLQVHALNSLREILTDSRFRTRTVPWLVEMLDLAASSLGSPIWAIRNCGLMLFRACASRIGTWTNVSEGNLPEQGPTAHSTAILAIAFKLLNPGHEIRLDSEIVFAGLDLLKWVRIAERDQMPIRQRILDYLGSPIWMIREHAARVYVCQVPEAEALEAVVGLLSSMTLNQQNRCHGVLLCSLELLEKHVSTGLPWPESECFALEQALQHFGPIIQEHGARLCSVRSSTSQTSTLLSDAIQQTDF